MKLKIIFKVNSQITLKVNPKFINKIFQIKLQNKFNETINIFIYIVEC